MKQKLVLFISFVLAVGILTGCAEKEDRNILEARAAIAKVDYAAARSAIETAPNLPETQSLRALLQLHNASGWSTDAAAWHGTIQKVGDYLQPLNTDVKTLETQEDPDSDDLDRLERLIRSRNSIAGLLANGLAAAAEKSANLPSELVNQPDSAAIIGLLEAEKCFDPMASGAAMMLIQKLGNTPTVSGLLISATQHPDADIRKGAVRHLGDLEDPKLIPTFESILKNKNESPYVLYNVIVALERLREEPIVPALKLATQTNAGQVRMHAAKLIGQLKAEEAIPSLIHLLADLDANVRLASINALTEIGNVSIAPLIEVLDSGAQNVLPDENSTEFLQLTSEYQYLANAYIDPTRRKNHRINTQAAAAQALGALKAEEAIPRLISLLDNDDLRVSAGAALQAMKGVAIPGLVDALKDPRDDVRIRSAEVLTGIVDLRSVDGLSEALMTDARKDVRAAAAKTLGVLRGRGTDNIARDALIQGLKLDDTTAANAATALGEIQIGTDEAIQELITMAMDKRGRETVRNAALSALTRLAAAQAVQPMLLLMLSDETSPALRKSAVAALGEIKAPESVPALVWVLGTRYEDIKDFQRHLKRQYNTLARLKEAITNLGVEWTGEYAPPDYRTWGELKPIPSLVRSEVALSLGKIKGDAVVQPLIDALKEDERAAVRKSAAFALGDVGGALVVDPLIEALRNDKQGIVRQEAAVALGKIKGDKVIDPLLTTLKRDKFEGARKQAAIALRELPAELADDGLVDVLKKGWGTFEEKQEVLSVQTEVITSLTKLGRAVTAKSIINALKSVEDDWTRWKLVFALGRLEENEDSPVDAMIAELEHPNYVVRKEAVLGLGLSKDRKSLEILTQILEGKNEYKSIRASAATALGTLLDERAAPSLLAALDDKHIEVRAQAVTALGAIREARAIDKLVQLFYAPLEDKTVKAACVTALGLIGGEKAEAVLLDILETDTERGDIFTNAVTGLGELKSTKAVPALIEILEDQSLELDARWDALAKLSARVKAAIALANIKDQRAAEAFGRRLVDESEYVIAIVDKDGKKIPKHNWGWENFVIATKPFQLPAFVAPKMVQRIEDPLEEWPVKAYAANALAKSDDPDVIPRIRELLADPIVQIRQHTALGVGEGKLSEFKDDLVKKMLGDGEANADVRRWATQGLGDLGDPSVVPALAETLNNDVNVIALRQDAALALGKIGDDAAVAALSAKLEALQASQSEKKLRIDILKALGEAKSQKAVPVLKAALEDSDGDIHFWAADALYKITGDGHGYHRVG
ncbi:HEAT repeat domain-containing protein [Candidatus Poribacteria bacterium]|nr:HEAT repeat domain-containing protein [Candidatus Poribacteria bacterium]